MFDRASLVRRIVQETPPQGSRDEVKELEESLDSMFLDAWDEHQAEKQLEKESKNEQELAEIRKRLDEIHLSTGTQTGSLITNDRLALIYLNSPESREWKSTELGELFGVDPSTIRSTPVWRGNQKLRRGAKNGRRNGNVTPSDDVDCE